MKEDVMKIRVFSWAVALSALALPFAGGCAAELSGAALDTAPAGVTNNAPATPDQSLTSLTNAPGPVPLVALPSDTNLVTELEDGSAEVDPATAPIKPAESSSLPELKFTPAALEIARLAQAGVEESVLMTYVTNSQNVFSLTAEQIIYLNDIGVPSVVITTMIQQDRNTKNAARGILIPETAPAASNSPPTAAEVAPQSDTPAQPTPAAPQQNVTQGTFETSLSPYGTWYEVEGYGRVWQPTVVVINNGWQPYYHGGRWIWTDSGWYWYSDYSWGWAPFHYGRWFRHHRIGWCWSPGTVWGPAWVSWRYSDSYCGWAPLPPAACYTPGFGFTYYGRGVSIGFDFGLRSDCYAFVPMRHFRSHRLHHHGVHRDHVHNVYNNTTVVNKFVNKNTTIINNGVPADHVAKATGTKVEKVSIRESRMTGGRGERLAANGNSLTVYRPSIPANESRLTQRPNRAGDAKGNGGNADVVKFNKASVSDPSMASRQGSRLTQRPGVQNTEASYNAKEDRFVRKDSLNSAPSQAAKPASKPGVEQKQKNNLIAREQSPDNGAQNQNRLLNRPGSKPNQTLNNTGSDRPNTRALLSNQSQPENNRTANPAVGVQGQKPAFQPDTDNGGRVTGPNQNRGSQMQSSRETGSSGSRLLNRPGYSAVSPGGAGSTVAPAPALNQSRSFTPSPQPSRSFTPAPQTQVRNVQTPSYQPSVRANPAPSIQAPVHAPQRQAQPAFTPPARQNIAPSMQQHNSFTPPAQSAPRFVPSPAPMPSRQSMAPPSHGGSRMTDRGNIGNGGGMRNRP